MGAARWGVVGVIVAALLGLIGWSVLGADPSEPPLAAASPARTAPAEAPASPSPSASPSPEPEPSEVLPANDVADPLEAIVAIEAYRDWLFEHPDPTKVDLIYHDACDCHALLQEQLSGLVRDGVKVVADPSLVDDITLIERDSPRTVILSFAIQYPEQLLESADGDVLERMAAQESPQTFRANLFLDDRGRWLITALNEVAP